MPKSYLDLKVWRLSMDLATAVYELSSSFPKQETYGLTSQVRRCAVSIPSNIAEGSARNSRKEFRQFVSIARGSSAELNTQLFLASRLGYSTDSAVANAASMNNEVSRMLSGLSTYLRAPETKSAAKSTKN